VRRFFCCNELKIQNGRRDENDDNVEGNIDARVAYALTYQSVSDLMVYRAVIRLHLSFSSYYGGLLVPRVLVVDDVPMVVVAIEVCFQRRGFKVTVADGNEAAFLLRAYGGDLRRDAGRHLQAINRKVASPPLQLPRVPLAFTTTSWLRKPFTPNALAAVDECPTGPAMTAQSSK
jgi:CheY-like chemotaxis protein